MTTTRTAAEALEEVLALEQKATPGTYRYSPWHVEEGEAAVRTSKGNLDWAITFASDNDAEFIATVVNFIRTHADTLRAALAPPQEGEAEELARRFEAYADDADQHALLMVPIVAATLRYATRLLRATQSNGRSPPSTAGNTVGQAGLTVGPNFDGESPAQLAPAQEPTITVSGPVACGKSYVMELIYKALRDAGLHPYSNELAHERRMVEEQPPPPAKVWKLHEAIYAAPPPPPAQEPVDVAASSIRNGSTNKGDKMINYTGRHKDSFDRFFASTQKEKPVGWRKDLNPPHGNFTLQWLEENPWPEQNHVQPLYAAPPPDEARELMQLLVQRYDDYRGKGVMPAPGEYQMVVGAIERIRAFLKDRT